MDIKLIIDAYACVMYVASYMMKNDRKNVNHWSKWEGNQEVKILPKQFSIFSVSAWEAALSKSTGSCIEIAFNPNETIKLISSVFKH